VLLLLGDGTRLPVTELPGHGPWTFLVLEPRARHLDPPPAIGLDPDPAVGPEPPPAEGPDPRPAAGPEPPHVAGPDPATPEPGAAARFLARYGRAVVPDLSGRPGFGDPPGATGFLELVDDLDQIRTRAGLGRPVLVGLGALAPVALRAAADQPWAWRALMLAPAARRPPRADKLDELDLPVLQLADPAPWDGQEPAAAVERLLGRLGGEPGWAGIAPDAPPR
jgi:pimeloyl-ACP methyl ester carboxylesterase